MKKDLLFNKSQVLVSCGQAFYVPAERNRLKNSCFTPGLKAKKNGSGSFFLSKAGKLLLLLFLLLPLQQVDAQAPPGGFTSVTVSSQWNEAVGLTFNKSGSQMFVWERGGKVWVVENSQKKLLLDISEEVGGWRDFGLLGFALHPHFETNGYLFLLYTVDRHHLMWHGTSSYNATADEYFNATIGRLTRYTATKTSGGYNVDPSSRKILIGATRSTGIPSLHESHGIGSLVFGTDGTLLISAGDGAGYIGQDGGSASNTYYAQALADEIISQQENVGAFRAQLLESYNGKILRIDPETGNGVSSNPFYESANPESVRSKVWALGLRNPFRMTLKPGSGSANPADGRPGILYTGDVGDTAFEELNAVSRGGQNFGWPLFEGLTAHSGYANLKRHNYFAPNPQYGINGCTQQYFYFQDLITQETASGTATFTNPCNTAQTISPSVKTFEQTRPLIDMQHSSTGPARTGTFSGETATVINIGAPGSPVSGPQFGGNAAAAGVFYPHDDFPEEYRNTLFFGDYAREWIRSITVDEHDKPVAVRNFINSGSVVVAMAAHPGESGLYYIHFPSEIRKVTYNVANRAPVAVASSDKSYGSGPLRVQFTGSASHDPDGQPLTYLWNFGDGATSTLADPSHTFAVSSSATTKYTVTLTVRDSQGSTGQASLEISVNNTPPQVTITSPADSTLYPLNGGNIVYPLRATVSHQQFSSSQLTYRWQTILHHNDHEHPEPYDSSPETSTTISPLGCEEANYYYRIRLTVTDPAGLSTTKEVKLYPDCSTLPVNQPPTVSISAPVSGANFTAPASITITATASDPDGTVSKVEFFRGSTKLGEDLTSPYSFNWSGVTAGSHSLTARATDNTGAVTTSTAVNITVNAPANQPPTVSISSPAKGANFTAPALITITANALDADGTVSKVEFYNGTIKLGEDLSSPYSFSWSSVPAGSYTLTARATDDAGAVTTSAGVNISVINPATGCTASGSILQEQWKGTKGTSVSTIPVKTKPKKTALLSSFEAPSNSGNNYGQRIRGYICAPANGNYIFYIASDENSELWLSTDDNPANKKKIASVTGFTAARQWHKYATQKSTAIALVAGKRYYIEALHKENKKDDHLAVGWVLPGTSSIQVISGSYLSPASTETTGKNSKSLRVTNQAQEDEPAMLSLLVYPNPNRGESFHVKGQELDKQEEVVFTLYNSAGIAVETYVAQADEAGTISVELPLPPNLSAGIYTFVMQGKKYKLSQKIFISR